MTLEVQDSRRTPLIGVIGGNKFPYTREIGEQIGYRLREHAYYEGGTIVVEAKSGLGTDVYVGVLTFCDKKYDTDDRFVVLVQDEVPEEYVDISKFTGQGLDFAAGSIEEVADALIVAGGNNQELVRAEEMLENWKHVITLPHTGGAAASLYRAGHNPNLLHTASDADEVIDHIFRLF
jgi:hypothetical protein